MLLYNNTLDRFLMFNYLDTYLKNNILWSEDPIDLQESFILGLFDLPIDTFLAMPFFTSTVFYIDSFSKLSFYGFVFVFCMMSF